MLQPGQKEVLSPHEPVKVAYDSLASTYDRRWRRYIDVSLAKVLSPLSLEGNERILDVACGTGELERQLFARWPSLHITAVDLCPRMLAQAQEKHIAGDVTWIEGEASNMPVPHRQFHVVICANSFHYFRKPLDCLREFHRCLIPNGRLVLVDWCDDFLACKLCGLWLKMSDPAFFCTYPMRNCRKLLQKAGFDVGRSERFKIGWLWGMMMFVCSVNEPCSLRNMPETTPG
jgi:ubiquinone/menaquinone biosynthesis C-methylase UbiE